MKEQLKYVATINDETLSETTNPDIEIEYVDIGDVDSTGKICGSTVYQFKDAPSRARRIVRHGDVIISTVRTYLQAIAAIESPPSNLVVSTGFAVVRPRKDLLNARFCKHALREIEFLHEVQARSVGVSYPAINASELGNISIPVPSLGEQEKLAQHLDRQTAKIDALIAAKQKLLTLLAEKRRALITHAVTRGLDPNVQLRDSGIEWLGKIPAHWKSELLKFHLSNIEQGWSPQSYSFPANEDEWGVLKVGAVNGWEFNPNENKKIPEDLKIPGEYEIKAGDVLVSRANTTELVGGAAFVKQVRPRLLLSDKLYRPIISSGCLLPEFLVYYLRSLTSRFIFERDSTGASGSMQNISQEILANLSIPIPPIDEQHRIIEHIKSKHTDLEKLESTTKRVIELLQERRIALISYAVTGKIFISA